MKKINLKNDQLQLYKRENSDFWQIKLKFPKQKAIRKTSGSKILEEAKKIALNYYKKNNKLKNLNSFIKYKKYHFKNYNLIETRTLSKKDIESILNEAQKYVIFNKQRYKKNDILNGKTIFNLFFEDSTRTRTSFEVAAKRLGADLINVAVKDSSINKGETLLDTITTINSMAPDMLIVRHPEEGISEKIAKIVNASIINAGDGSHEHPTQALLDALTIKRKFKKFRGLNIAICGDVLHSRVARSNIQILTTLGANINIIGPKIWIPKDIQNKNVKVYYNMKKGLKNCDIVMMLRLQNERMNSSFLSSNREYYEYYGLTPDKLDCAKKDALIMHPGPMNRGIEIDTNLADDINKSVIQEQVELGVAVRMACLKIFCN